MNFEKSFAIISIDPVFDGVCKYLSVVIFESVKICSLGTEFPLRHALSVVPVKECTLGIHFIKSASCLLHYLRDHLVLMQSVDRVARGNRPGGLIFILATHWRPRIRLDGSCDAVAHVFGPGQQFILFQLAKRSLQVCLGETSSEKHGAPKVFVWLLRFFAAVFSGRVR